MASKPFLESSAFSKVELFSGNAIVVSLHSVASNNIISLLCERSSVLNRFLPHHSFFKPFKGFKSIWFTLQELNPSSSKSLLFSKLSDVIPAFPLSIRNFSLTSFDRSMLVSLVSIEYKDSNSGELTLSDAMGLPEQLTSLSWLNAVRSRLVSLLFVQESSSNGASCGMVSLSIAHSLAMIFFILWQLLKSNSVMRFIREQSTYVRIGHLLTSKSDRKFCEATSLMRLLQCERSSSEILLLPNISKFCSSVLWVKSSSDK